MNTYEETFTAGAPKRFDIAGRFFRIITAADGTISAKWLKMGREIGEANAVGAFFAIDLGTAQLDFDAVILTSSTTQTVKFAISPWAVEAL